MTHNPNNFQVYVRDPNGNRQGQLDDFVDLEIIPAFCDVGTWTCKFSAQSRMASYLMTPNWGLTVVRNGNVLMSGPTDVRTYTVDLTTNQIELSGFSDEVWIKNRNVHPCYMETDPPYTTQAYDAQTGVASTVFIHYVNVNLGPGAIPARQMPNLVMAGDAGIGSTVIGNGRWDNLLTFLQTLQQSSGGVGFKIVQENGGFTFYTYQTVDRSGWIKFSTALGNLAKFEYDSTRPTGNYFFCGGDGDGTARTIQESWDGDSVNTWGRIEGDFVSSSGTTNSTVLDQAGTNALSTGSEQASLNITPMESETMLYGEDYFLGDLVTVQLAQPVWTPSGISGQVVAPLQKVDIHLASDGTPVSVTPMLGSSTKANILKLFREFRFVKARLNNLERY